MAKKLKTIGLFIDDDQRLQVVPPGKGPPAEGISHLDLASLFSLMKYRCGDPMFPEDYERLDALRPGEPWPRRKEPKKISDIPAYVWNKRELALALELSPTDLEEVITLPGAPSRMANGRWPARAIAEFMVSFMKERMAEARGEQ